MLYFQILAVAIGLFILSDPFKAEDIEEPHVPSHITTALSEETRVDQPHVTPPSSDSPLEEKDSKSAKSSAKDDLKDAAAKAAMEEFKPEVLLEAVKKTHAARLEETQQRKDTRQAAGLKASFFDNLTDVFIPSVKHGFSFIFSEVLPRAVNVAVKTAPIWMPMVLALL